MSSTPLDWVDSGAMKTGSSSRVTDDEKCLTRRQSQRRDLSRIVLAHAPRQLPSWLIFDVSRSNPMSKAQSGFLDFVRLVVDGDIDEVSRRLGANPALATAQSEIGATRQSATEFFFRGIAHYFYA